MRTSRRGLLLLCGLLPGCDPTDALTHDVTTPTITITGISPGETLFANRVITITVSDLDSELGPIEVYGDGTSIFEDNPSSKSASYQFTLIVSRETAGQHRIEVEAFDEAGNMREYSFIYHVFAP